MSLNAMRNPGLLLGMLALLVCTAGVCGEKAKEKTPAEIVQMAKRASASPLERVDAIAKLAVLTDSNVIRDNRVVEDLIAIAKPSPKAKTDIFVRQAAIDALSRIQKIEPRAKDKYIPAFSPILKDKTEHMIVARAVALNYKENLDKDGLPDRDAYKIISDLAKDKTTNLGVRMVCIDTLGTFGAPEGLDILVQLLGEQEQLVREHSAGSLYELMSRLEGTTNLPVPAVNKLVEMIGDRNFSPDLKVNVMKVLGTLIRDGNMSAKAALPEITRIVANEQDEKLVKGGIIALGLIGTSEAVEPLVKAYNDFFVGAKPVAPDAANPNAAALPVTNTRETEIRLAIMQAFVSVMSNQGQKTAPDMKAVTDSVTVLTKAMAEDADTGVRKGAIFALRYLYPAPMKPAWKLPTHTMAGLLTKEGSAVSEEMKREVVASLQAITGQDFGTDYKRWDKWILENIK